MNCTVEKNLSNFAYAVGKMVDFGSGGSIHMARHNLRVGIDERNEGSDATGHGISFHRNNYTDFVHDYNKMFLGNH